MDISCIILAGGKSIRFGHDKILEKINNTSLLDQVISQVETLAKDIIIVTANERAFTHLAGRKNIRITNDIIPGMGSLGGIYTGLVESRTHQNLVVAADMPFLNKSLLRYMIGVAEGYDFTLPHINSWYEPLHAIYSKNCIGPAKAIFDEGKRVIVELFKYVKVRYVEAEEIDRYDPQHLSFFNINTQQDMERALKIIGRDRRLMLTVEEALNKILSEISVLETETVPILDSLGQVLAEDIVSTINVPPLDNSAMDGYAVRAADTKGASEKTPKILKVIDTVIAGGISKKEVTPGAAIRIMTGAPLPKGADSVIQFELTDEEKRKKESPGTPAVQVSIMAEIKAGDNIRLGGEDVKRGATILKKGAIIRPGEIGVMASIGHGQVKVIRRPVVAVLSTGDELVEIGQKLPEGKIYNSNTYSIASLVKRYGGIPKILGIAKDNEKDLVNKLKEAQDADMLLTTGGVSMGDYDMVKDILARDGQMVFWKVRVKPGKPLAFGKIKGKSKDGKEKTIPHLGLPGNATSCMVSFELFVRPGMLKMMGKKRLEKPSVPAIINESVKNDAGRRIYDRAITEKLDGHYIARLTGPQGSGILTSMALANSLVIIPEEKDKVTKGDTVQALMLDWNEEVET